MGARENPERAYHLGMNADEEDYASSETVRRLRMAKSRHPVAPLFVAQWE